MSEVPPFEVPPALRELAERNVEQARVAYHRLMDVAGKTQQEIARSSDSMGQAALDIQGRYMRFTQQNMSASFAFAADLARASDAKEVFELQARYAREQMEIYTRQAQELTRVMAQAALKAQPKP